MSSCECPNCGGTEDDAWTRCNRCGELRASPGGGIPRFSDQARDAGVSLGGLLVLQPTVGVRVRYIGRCPAGAFALDGAGQVVWTADWGYLSGIELRDGELRMDGRLVDRETGVLVQPAVHVAGAANLLALHKALLEAKFHPLPSNTHVAGSPLVAKIANDVYDALIAVEECAGRSDQALAWRNWRRAESKPWIFERLREYVKENPRWSGWSEAERRDYVRAVLSPFVLEEAKIEALLR